MKNIFISSTFKDMQAERDLVQKRVLPTLREEAGKYGENINVIDLRWGVDTSSLETEEGAAKVLSVCLDEIDRSHPYMLIFLGERYGWIPEKKLIKNAIGNRAEKYSTDDFEKSVTALEIEYGALAEEYGQLENCVICFREPIAFFLDEADREVYQEQDARGREKLRALKERIKKDLNSKGHFISYSGQWDESVHRLTNFMAEGQPLEEVLIKCYIDMFQKDWEEYEKLSWQEKEQLAFRAVMEQQLRSFTGREEVLEKYYQKAVHGKKTLVIQGEVGSGKTSLMCQMAKRLSAAGNPVFVLFAGVGNMSTTAEQVVEQMVYFMENLPEPDRKNELDDDEIDLSCVPELDMDEIDLSCVPELDEEEIVFSSAPELEEAEMEEDHSTESLYEQNIKRIRNLSQRLGKGERIYFCLDGLNQLQTDEHTDGLDFLFSNQEIQMIVSCSEDYPLPLEAIFPRETVKIPALKEEEQKAVIRSILASYSRNSYEDIEGEIVKKKQVGNPLYISLLLQRLNMMDGKELYEAHSEEEIVKSGMEIIRNMPENVEEAVVRIVEDGIEKISSEKEMLWEVICYLAVSRSGLSMQDIQNLFENKGKIISTLDFSRFMKYMNTFFYRQEEDRINFTHSVIREGLLQKIEDKSIYENHILEYLKTLECENSLRLQEGIYYARMGNDSAFARDLIQQLLDNGNMVLAKAIKNEMIADEEEFFLSLVQKDYLTMSKVLRKEIWGLLDVTVSHLHRKVELLQGLIKFGEERKELSVEEDWEELAYHYKQMGNALMQIGNPKGALQYYEKEVSLREEFSLKFETQENIRFLITTYHENAEALREQGKIEESLEFEEKALKCIEKMYEKYPTKTNFEFLCRSYYNTAYIMTDVGRCEEAYEYCKKYNLHVWSMEEGDSQKLRMEANGYFNMGRVLRVMEKPQEAVTYYKLAIEYMEEIWTKHKSEEMLNSLAVKYLEAGYVYMDLKQFEEALEYLQKSYGYAKELQEKRKSDSSLRNMAVCMNAVGNVLLELKRYEEALPYVTEALEHSEILYQKESNKERGYRVRMGYKDVADTLIALERYEEARSYYEKYIDFIYNKSGLNEIRIWLEMAHTLSYLERGQEATRYYQKGIHYAKDFYEKDPSVENCKILAGTYHYMLWELNHIGEYEEALIYCQKCLDVIKLCMEEQYEFYLRKKVFVGREMLYAYDKMKKYIQLEICLQKTKKTAKELYEYTKKQADKELWEEICNWKKKKH